MCLIKDNNILWKWNFDWFFVFSVELVYKGPEEYLRPLSPFCPIIQVWYFLPSFCISSISRTLSKQSLTEVGQNVGIFWSSLYRVEWTPAVIVHLTTNSIHFSLANEPNHRLSPIILSFRQSCRREATSEVKMLEYWVDLNSLATWESWNEF